MSAAKSWFVKTGFGASLGPMPDDALHELVRTGALVRTDQVRERTEGDWRTAAEIPGLFESEASQPAVAVDVPTVACELAEPVVLMPDLKPIAARLIVPEPPVVSSRQESSPSCASVNSATIPITDETTAPSGSEQPAEGSRPDTNFTIAPHDDSTVATTAPPEDELITAWKLERSRSREELAMVSLASEMVQSKAEEDLAPELPAELATSPTFPTAVSTAQRSSLQRLAFLDQITGLEEGPRPPVESTRQKWDRWRRSLPSWPIVTALVVVMLVTWWLWPRSQRGTYDRYVALWSEWKTRRADVKDKEGWERFLSRAEAELDNIVLGLEKNTRPMDQEKLLMLFIGRDCLRKMLRRPKQIGSPQEKQLESLLAQARELYEPSAPAKPREAFIGAKSRPPKSVPAQPASQSRTPGVIPLPQSPAGKKSEPPVAVPMPTELPSPQ